METIRFSCIESRIENNRCFYGRFQLGPFFSGQGLTIANALRRTLLSELSGLAILYVEIEGASHEYSTLPGMKESVLDLLLSLKQLVFTSNFSNNDPQIGYLYFQGPGVVKGSDLKLPSSIQIVDPDQYIATLSYDGVLQIRFIICQGKNYFIHNKSQNSNFGFINSKLQISEISDYLNSFGEKSELKVNRHNAFESRTVKATLSKSLEKYTDQKIDAVNESFQKNIQPILVLPIDAVFMPVKNVNFVLENDDDLDMLKERVILEIWTNGSIHPKQAIHEASSYLVALFSSFQEKNTLSGENRFSYQNSIQKDESILTFSSASSSGTSIFDNQKHSSAISQKFFRIVDKKLTSLDIGNLDLSLRPYTCLKRANIHTVADLLEYSREELLLLKNFGKRSLEEVEKNLYQLGLRLHAHKNNELFKVNREIE